MDSLQIYLFGSLISFVSGIVGGSGGGGGLVAVPGLLFLGLSPITVLAATKFLSAFGSIIPTYYFFRKKMIDIKKHWYVPIIAFTFNFLGVQILNLIPKQHLEILIPILLILATIYIIFNSSKLQDEETPGRYPQKALWFLLLPVLCIYHGFFGPGFGIFFVIITTSFFGFSSRKGTAYARFITLFSMMGGCFFYASRCLPYKMALVFSLFFGLGSMISAKLVVSKGSAFLRPFLLFLTIAISVREIIHYFL